MFPALPALLCPHRMHRGLRLHGAGQLGGIFLGRKRLIQLRHSLDALHDLEPQPQLQYIGDVGRHGRLYGACPGVGVRHHALSSGHGCLPAHHAVKDGGKAVLIGVAPLKLGGGVLLRRGVALVQLLVQAAACGAQTHGGIPGQTAPAICHYPDILRADAAVYQPCLVHGCHALKHRAQHGAGILGPHRSGTIFQPLLQRGATQVFQHRIHGVIGLHHVQHGLQTAGGGNALDGAVQVCKVHAGGLEQHLAPLLGAQDAVRAPLRRKSDRQVLLDGHPESAQILHAAVQHTFAVQTAHLAHGIAPSQHRAHRQAARRVASL